MSRHFIRTVCFGQSWREEFFPPQIPLSESYIICADQVLNIPLRQQDQKIVRWGGGRSTLIPLVPVMCLLGAYLAVCLWDEVHIWRWNIQGECRSQGLICAEKAVDHSHYTIIFKVFKLFNLVQCIIMHQTLADAINWLDFSQTFWCQIKLLIVLKPLKDTKTDISVLELLCSVSHFIIMGAREERLVTISYYRLRNTKRWLEMEILHKNCLPLSTRESTNQDRCVPLHGDRNMSSETADEAVTLKDTRWHD